MSGTRFEHRASGAAAPAVRRSRCRNVRFAKWPGRRRGSRFHATPAACASSRPVSTFPPGVDGAPGSTPPSVSPPARRCPRCLPVSVVGRDRWSGPGRWSGPLPRSSSGVVVSVPLPPPGVRVGLPPLFVPSGVRARFGAPGVGRLPARGLFRGLHRTLPVGTSLDAGGRGRCGGGNTAAATTRRLRTPGARGVVAAARAAAVASGVPGAGAATGGGRRDRRGGRRVGGSDRDGAAEVAGGRGGGRGGGAPAPRAARTSSADGTAPIRPVLPRAPGPIGPGPRARRPSPAGCRGGRGCRRSRGGSGPAVQWRHGGEPLGRRLAERGHDRIGPVRSGSRVTVSDHAVSAPTGTSTPGQDVFGCGASASAAPLAIAFFGSASTATGRPSCSETSCATSGIRDEPPTSRTAVSCVGGQPGGGDGAAQRGDGLLERRADQLLELAAVQPHRARGAGQQTGTDASVSELSASLASVQLAAHPGHGRQHVRCRSRRGRSNASGAPARTWSNTASSKSMPPSCSTPSGRPSRAKPGLRAASLRSTAASNVPPPRS